MEQTWRWYGPKDNVSLSDARQAGATGIVTALHHIPTGTVWPEADVLQRKAEVEAGGLRWSVAESIPVHESIKTQSGNYRQYIENYQQSIRNLASAGVQTLCYNFMPVLDATRTDHHYALPNGALALDFNAKALAAFELFLLKRPGAEAIYTIAQQEKAKAYLNTLSSHEQQKLITTIVAGFPGVGEDYKLEDMQAVLDTYKDIDAATLKQHLSEFLQAVVPVAEEEGIRMTIHPDDPPFSVLGLPRIVSTEEDIRQLLGYVDSDSNGFCLCTGSLGVRKDNDLPGIVERLGERMHFVHLRSTKRDEEGNFHEADHLDGDVDMFAVINAILEEQHKRKLKGENPGIPMRPDHGHQMLDDLQKNVIPGYSGIGRLRGLAEIRGLELGIKRAFGLG